MKWFVMMLVLGVALAIGCSKDEDKPNTGPIGPVNHAPVIESIEATPVEVLHQRTLTLACVATDADRDTIIYVWSCTNGVITPDGSNATWLAPLESGPFWIKVTANDGVELAVDSVEVTVTANRLPVIEFVTAEEQSIIHGHSVGIICTAYDLDGDILRYSWRPSSGTTQGSGPSILWFAPQASGDYWVSVTVSDGLAAVKDSIMMTIRPNRIPEILGMVATPEKAVFGDRPTIFCNAYDPDIDNLIYRWNYRAGNLYGEGSTITWQAPNITGTYWISVDVSDGFTSVRDTILIDVIQGNNAPNSAFNPSPGSGALNIDPARVILSWQCDDPDGDQLLYDVYFGPSPPWGAIYQRNLVGTTHVITGLNPDMQYYWGVIAKDGKGGESRITAWNFHTRQ